MEEAGEQQGLLSLTTEIVAAFAGHNTVATSDLPGLIGTVYAALRAAGMVEAEKPVEGPVPAVPIKKSVTPDFIVCLDGKKLKMLKRHLATSYNMTPAAYRQRWGLAADYPMVAPSYAAQRSELAKSIGLGRKPVEAAPKPESEPAPPAERPARRVAVGRKLPKAAA